MIASVQRNSASAIWVGPSDAPDRARQITSGRWDGMRGFAFAPNGQLVYSGNHAENWDLFLADADGWQHAAAFFWRGPRGPHRLRGWPERGVQRQHRWRRPSLET